MIDTLANLPLISPFIEFGFMRRALAGCLALSLGATPIGVFLMLRRMSLAGDAISHAILPGAAIGYLIAGLSLSAMTLGGLVAGIAVALEAELARAEIRQASDVPADVVRMNSTVICEDETSGVRHDVRLVYPGEGISDGDVSILAPVGAALLGLRAGQTIEWPLPGGRTTRLRVTSVLARSATD